MPQKHNIAKWIPSIPQKDRQFPHYIQRTVNDPLDKWPFQHIHIASLDTL